MAKKYKSISANNDLAYYTSKKNIPNQDLVKETVEYFTTGEGARAFKPLEFLNLLEYQYQFIVSNIADTDRLISNLETLPLNNLERHILYGLLIKWFGGYPISEASGFGNSELHYQFNKKLLELFLSYEGETPEKEFCKADNELRKEFRKLGKVFTTAINNNNIDAVQLYNSMSEPRYEVKTYSTFDEMFRDAANKGAFGEIENNQVFEIKKCRYDFEFTEWLYENKELEYGNSEQYQTFLNKETFLEYLKYDKEQEQQKLIAFENEKKSWKIEPPQQTETKTEQETPTFTNNFDNIKPTEIYNHFKAGLVEKGYLTEQELNEYLKAAFELKTIPETLFKLKHTPTKQKIYTIFYIYYKDISQKKHERQKEYAALLGDYFEGYKTEVIQTNWARDYKTKR